MTVEILSPDFTIFKGTASIITLPGKKGSFQVLENHAPIISILNKGKITFKSNENPTSFNEGFIKKEASVNSLDIVSGTVEVSNNTVSILVELT